MRKLNLALYLLVMLSWAVSSTAIAQDGSHRVRVTMIAQKSSLHTSVNNRDVYLLRVTPRNGDPFDALVVDNYPSFAGSLPDYLGREGVEFSVALRRVPYCDRNGNNEAHLTRCFEIGT